MIWLFLILVVVALIILYNNNSESFRDHRRGRGRGRGRVEFFNRGRYRRPRYRRQWAPFWWSWRGNCPNGCTALGNEGWGCQFPGYNSDDCMFAEDCKFCRGRSRWWW